MFECSLFASTEDITHLLESLTQKGWDRLDLNHTERIYIGDNKKIIIIPEKNKLIYKSIYDYNKNRTSICCAYNSYTIIKALNEEKELEILNIKFKKELKITGFFLKKNNLNLEISKFNNLFLLKLFIYCEIPSEGEKFLERGKEELKEYFSFVKPPVDWMNIDFKK